MRNSLMNSRMQLLKSISIRAKAEKSFLSKDKLPLKHVILTSTHVFKIPIIDKLALFIIPTLSGLVILYFIKNKPEHCNIG